MRKRLGRGVDEFRIQANKPRYRAFQVRLAKTTQEQKTQMDVATALAMGDKAAVGTRCASTPKP